MSRRLLISGAASGIGRALALAQVAAGARVCAFDIDGAGLAELAGQGITTVEGDAANPDDIERAAQLAVETFGGLDGLVPCAARSTGRSVAESDADDWATILALNVTGPALLARACLPALEASKGAIVFVASQLALAGGRGNAPYIASKGAILSLTRTLAVDCAAAGVRVNAVAPGAVETPMLERSFGRRPDPAAARAASEARHAMGRLGQPEEIAHAIGFLLDPASSFITGAVLPVDGGWLAA
jgi:NAD(P)-dependent dehydrogenase (short-subunit alcohol dehydrogenase family)